MPATPKKANSMKAMVLAAGEGTRLRPLTLTLPKPLVPIANEPLLARTLRLLAGQNVRDVAVNLHYRAEKISGALGDPARLGLRTLFFSPEETLLGTAGAVRRVGPTFLDETFLVLYGDNLYRFDIEPLVAFHREKAKTSGAVATIATFEAQNPSACGLVITDADGRVTRFQEKPPPEEVFTNTANAGVYVLEPEIFRYLPAGEDPLDWGKEVFPSLLDLGIIFSRPLGGYLQDTGTPETYRQANWDALAGRTGDPPPAGANGSLLLGANTNVAPGVQWDGYNIVGDNCAIEAGAHLADSILWDGCRIGAGARLQNAVLGTGVVVGPGAFIEDGALLADNMEVAPGAIVPANARLAPHSHYPAAEPGT